MMRSDNYCVDHELPFDSPEQLMDHIRQAHFIGIVHNDFGPRHDYEPGDTTHKMSTDPDCRICGEPKKECERRNDTNLSPTDLDSLMTIDPYDEDAL